MASMTDRVCETCGSMFEIATHLLLGGYSSGRFCSRRCVNNGTKHRAHVMSGRRDGAVDAPAEAPREFQVACDQRVVTLLRATFPLRLSEFPLFGVPRLDVVARRFFGRNASVRRYPLHGAA